MSQKKRSCYNFYCNGEIATVLAISTVFVVSAISLLSSLFLQSNQTTISRAQTSITCPDGGIATMGSNNTMFCDYSSNKSYFIGYQSKVMAEDCHEFCLRVDYSGSFPYDEKCHYSSPSVCRRTDKKGGCAGLCDWQICQQGKSHQVTPESYNTGSVDSDFRPGSEKLTPGPEKVTRCSYLNFDGTSKTTTQPTSTPNNQPTTNPQQPTSNPVSGTGQVRFGDWDAATARCQPNPKATCICYQMGTSGCKSDAIGKVEIETGRTCIANKWDNTWGCWAYSPTAVPTAKPVFNNPTTKPNNNATTAPTTSANQTATAAPNNTAVPTQTFAIGTCIKTPCGSRNEAVSLWRKYFEFQKSGTRLTVPYFYKKEGCNDIDIFTGNIEQEMTNWCNNQKRKITVKHSYYIEYLPDDIDESLPKKILIYNSPTSSITKDSDYIERDLKEFARMKYIEQDEVYEFDNRSGRNYLTAFLCFNMHESKPEKPSYCFNMHPQEMPAGDNPLMRNHMIIKKSTPVITNFLPQG